MYSLTKTIYRVYPEIRMAIARELMPICSLDKLTSIFYNQLNNRNKFLLNLHNDIKRWQKDEW